MNKFEIEDAEKIAKDNELCKWIWNAAIEKCRQEVLSKSHILLPLEARIDLFKIKG